MYRSNSLYLFAFRRWGFVRLPVTASNSWAPDSRALFPGLSDGTHAVPGWMFMCYFSTMQRSLNRHSLWTPDFWGRGWGDPSQEILHDLHECSENWPIRTHRNSKKLFNTWFWKVLWVTPHTVINNTCEFKGGKIKEGCMSEAICRSQASFSINSWSSKDLGTLLQVYA